MEHMRLSLGDITELKVDAIVNAANQRMLGGGGVDGAIHDAAGEGLYEECLHVAEVSPGIRCPTGQARITGGHNLPAAHVIHTVGPVWDEDNADKCRHLLASCYRESLRLAEAHGLETIAFPCISTGVYSFPHADAADIAHATVRDWLQTHELPREVIFCCYSDLDAKYYRMLLARDQCGGQA